MFTVKTNYTLQFTEVYSSNHEDNFQNQKHSMRTNSDFLIDINSLFSFEKLHEKYLV